MPIMDAQWLFCESMSIAKNAGQSTDSTNYVYLAQVYDHKGVAMYDRPNVSGRLYLNIVVEDEDLAAAVNGSVVTFTLHADTDATTITTDGSAIITKAITVNQTSNYPDGTQICCIPLPIEQINSYFQLKASVATQNLSTGKITAFIGPPIQQG